MCDPAVLDRIFNDIILKLMKRQEGKRLDPNIKSDLKHQAADLKRIQKFRENVIKSCPDCAQNLCYVDNWAKQLRENHIKTCKIRQLLKQGKKMKLYTTFANSDRQWCVARVQLACVWKEFLPNIKLIVETIGWKWDQVYFPSGNASVNPTVTPQINITPKIDKVHERSPETISAHEILCPETEQNPPEYTEISFNEFWTGYSDEDNDSIF